MATQALTRDDVQNNGKVRIWSTNQNKWIERYSIDAHELLASGQATREKPKDGKQPQQPQPQTDSGKQAQKA